MTATDHLRAARHHRNEAQADLLAAHFAAEHGDAIRAREHHAEHDFHLSVSRHHEVQATHARLTAAEAPNVEGLTDGPVHVAQSNLPSDEAITS